MGIFNEHSHNNPFVRGIQGAPGVGFNLTSSGDYDMINKKLRNVGVPESNTDAATKKYVDDNSGGGKTTLITVDSNIDMKDTYRILNLKTPSDADEAATKSYTDNNFLKTDGTKAMTQDLNLGAKRITHLSDPTGEGDAATKRYTDNLVNTTVADYVKRDGTSAMTGEFNTAGHKIINLRTPTSNSEPATKNYVDNNFLNLDGSEKMTGNLDMGSKEINNLPLPTRNKQPTKLGFTDLKYLHVAGTNKMTNNLNMDNKKIINLRIPTDDTDAATKKYVDDNSSTAPDLSSYLKKDGSVAMTRDLNVGGHKITNLKTPTSDNDATTKKYIDSLVHHTSIQPSHYNDQFIYLMSSAIQWTDEIDGGTSFNITGIGNLMPNLGNFHDYNHKVLNMTIFKNSQGGYKYKMGINFYRLTANVDYTLCLEILNIDNKLWHKTQISVDKGTSTGLTIGNVGVRKLSHRYIDPKGQTQFLYYHRIIVNFKKLSSGNKFFLHILVNIPQVGTDLAVYPKQFLGVYMIAYGIMGTTSNLDPDKVYDYHTAFDIKPREVVYNVDINANHKSIKNVRIDPNDNSSVATIGQIKSMNNFTINNIYRQYFEEFYDFTDADRYRLRLGSSGTIIYGLKTHITFPNKDLSSVKKDGLDVINFNVTFSPPYSSIYTLCIVFYHWTNKSFSLIKKDSANNNILITLQYNKRNNKMILSKGRNNQSFTVPRSFNGKRIVLWLTENFNTNVTKAKISNYASTLTLTSAHYSANQIWKFFNEGGLLNKLMYSKNFYDFDSEHFHKVMLQEKLSGSYIV